MVFNGVVSAPGQCFADFRPPVSQQPVFLHIAYEE